jgi:anti-anti-sigma factor
LEDVLDDCRVRPSNAPLTVTVQIVGRVAVCELDGELDHETTALLLDAVGWLGPGSIDSLILDCAKLAFVDARGLTGLLRARAAAPCDHVALANPSAMLSRIVTATALTEVLPTADPALLSSVERPRAVVHRLR